MLICMLRGRGTLLNGHDRNGRAVQEAKPGNKVGVRYKGWLAKTNKVFDQTKGSKTFNFRVGAARSPLSCSGRAASHTSFWHPGCICMYFR